jgi:protein-L-isoaspartate O-methyltransferase
MMTLTSEQIAPHMARFLDMLNTAFRRYGMLDGLPERFRDAVAATPRHMFVHRFRLSGRPLRDRIDEGALRDNDADPIGELADIYSDAVMIHVDASGERLPSTNSQPSYVLWLLDLLDLRPGQRVLEIGSGSGWLAAVCRLQNGWRPGGLRQ